MILKSSLLIITSRITNLYRSQLKFVLKLNKTMILVFVLIGMLPPVFFRVISIYQGEAVGPISSLLITMITSVLMTVIISYGVVSVMIWLQRNHPWKNGIIKRLILEIVLTYFTACILIIAISLILKPIYIQGDVSSTLFRYVILALIMNTLLVAITEGIFFFEQWRNSVISAERFKKESVKAQLESLKNQVNPHFLFNSLNTLSSLIDEDKELSKEFVDDLSSVYRYVLKHKDEEVVTVKSELDFIHSFTSLLKRRHGDRIHFHYDIDIDQYNKGVPPMALQLLVENAVKHNIASKNRPLTVEIFSANNQLVVRNNLQKKSNVKSNGIGLKNIQQRYDFLGDENISISRSEQYFQVALPTFTFIK